METVLLGTSGFILETVKTLKTVETIDYTYDEWKIKIIDSSNRVIWVSFTPLLIMNKLLNYICLI